MPDQTTSETYSRVKAELAETGRLIPDNGIWIAAMARQFDLPLVTRDSHFAAVPRLTTLAWWTPLRADDENQRPSKVHRMVDWTVHGGQAALLHLASR